MALFRPVNSYFQVSEAVQLSFSAKHLDGLSRTVHNWFVIWIIWLLHVTLPVLCQWENTKT